VDLGLGGKGVLITGAAKGIGRSTALAFAREGAKIGINYVRSADHAQRTAAECRALGATVALLPYDISDEDEVDTMIDQAEAELGAIDVLVNNAGIYTTQTLAQLDTVTWRALFDVNVHGAYFCSRRVLPRMVERRWGRIVNIVGYSAKTGGAILGRPAYGAASKAALMGLTRSLAWEGAASGVTVNGISPGVVATDIMAPLLADPNRLAMLMERIPTRRVSQPEEIAHLVLFLASDLAGSITGQIIDISGGALMS